VFHWDFFVSHKLALFLSVSSMISAVVEDLSAL